MQKKNKNNSLVCHHTNETISKNMYNDCFYLFIVVELFFMNLMLQKIISSNKLFWVFWFITNLTAKIITFQVNVSI